MRHRVSLKQWEKGRTVDFEVWTVAAIETHTKAHPVSCEVHGLGIGVRMQVRAAPRRPQAGSNFITPRRPHSGARGDPVPGEGGTGRWGFSHLSFPGQP